MKFAAFIIVLLFYVDSAMAGPDDPVIRLLNDKRKEMVAGSTSNVLVMLTNHSDTIKEVQIEIYSQDNNLKQIIKYPPTRIERNSSVNKILNVSIPDKTKAGDYSIEVVAFEKPANKKIGRVILPVHVLPRYEIRVDKLKAPRFLFSGDTLGVKFLLQNLSNLDVTVIATIINNRILETRSYNMPVDSAILVTIPVSVEKNTGYNTMQNVTFSGSVSGKPETESSGTYSFDIIPSSNVKFDGYNRFPVKVSGMFASDNRSGELVYGSMFDIQGGGLINEKNKLEFHLRGPDRGGNPILGQNDEYSVKYSTNRVEVLLGDNNYSLSDLTESSRSGRGAKLLYIGKKLSVGSFFHMPRYYPGFKQIYSGYTEYRINDKIRFSAGYLSKEDTIKKKAALMTFSGYLNPFKWGNTEFELATGQLEGKQARAYRLSFNINNSLFNSHVNFTRAEPGFPGYITNSMYLASGISANLLKKLSLSLNYDINRANLALDTLYANAPFSKNMNVLASFRLNQDNSVNFGVYQTGLEDQAANPLFNYKKYDGRVTLQNKFGPVNLNIQGQIGKVINFLEVKSGEMTDFYSGYFYMKYSFNKSLLTSAFVNYQGGKQFTITGFNRFYYGGSLQASLKKKLYVSLDYQSNYELTEYFRERSLLTSQLHYQLNSNHEIQLSSNYNLAKNSLDKKDFSVLIRYTYTINIPLSKKKNVGSLTGKVINMGVGNIEGIIFQLDGNYAKTDKNGNFDFPMIKIGDYILTMNESSVGINAITGVPGPYRVTIVPGTETQFEMILTRSALIRGRLVIEEDEKSGGKGYYPVKEEIDKLIVEASNGTETFRILTGRDGTFSFEDLRPGSWHVKIYPNGIPQGYSLDNDLFNISLIPGKEEKLDVILRKKSRVIKFQKK